MFQWKALSGTIINIQYINFFQSIQLNVCKNYGNRYFRSVKSLEFVLLTGYRSPEAFLL
jgi:hypothetical protein